MTGGSCVCSSAERAALFSKPAEIPGAGAAMPPEEIIDFILDRPFLFVIATYQGTPLFTGVVNEP